MTGKVIDVECEVITERTDAYLIRANGTQAWLLKRLILSNVIVSQNAHEFTISETLARELGFIT